MVYTSAAATKVLVISKYDMLAGAIEAFLANHPQYTVDTCCYTPLNKTIVEVVAEVVSGSYVPSVVIIDETGYNLKTVFDLANLISRCNPNVKLVFLSSVITHTKIALALDRGFHGIFCLEDRLKTSFFDLVDRLFAETLVLTPTASYMYGSYREAQRVFGNLPETSRLILMMLYEGYKASEIAPIIGCNSQSIYVFTMRLRATFNCETNDELLDKISTLFKTAV